MAPVSTTNFPASTVPQAPEDPLFGLMAAYRADQSKDKVDLGIGAYRDDNAKPWVLPVVKKVRSSLLLLLLTASQPVSVAFFCRHEPSGPPAEKLSCVTRQPQTG